MDEWQPRTPLEQLLLAVTRKKLGVKEAVMVSYRHIHAHAHMNIHVLYKRDAHALYLSLSSPVCSCLDSVVC